MWWHCPLLERERASTRWKRPLLSVCDKRMCESFEGCFRKSVWFHRRCSFSVSGAARNKRKGYFFPLNTLIQPEAKKSRCSSLAANISRMVLSAAATDHFFYFKDEKFHWTPESVERNCQTDIRWALHGGGHHVRWSLESIHVHVSRHGKGRKHGIIVHQLHSHSNLCSFVLIWLWHFQSGKSILLCIYRVIALKLYCIISGNHTLLLPLSGRGCVFQCTIGLFNRN